MSHLSEMEARTEKRRGSTGGGYTGTAALSAVNSNIEDGELTEEEIEKMEREEEDKYFDEVLRVNAGDDDGEFDDYNIEPRLVEIMNDDDDDDEEDRYFEMVLQANTERPSAFPESDDVQGNVECSEKGNAKGDERGGRGSGGRVTEGVQSRSNSTFSAYDIGGKAPPPTVCTTQAVVDFTESLTMTAMEKGIPATPYSPALSRSRPSTSLSFASPSSNPFGKENRSKSDEEENLLQATLLSDSLLEQLSLKKIDDKSNARSGERIDLSIFSSAATATATAIAARSANNVDMKKNTKAEDSPWDTRQRPKEIDSNTNTNTIEVESINTDLGSDPGSDSVLIPPVPKVPFRGVNGYPASIIVKGARSCNLPDHHVTAGCTAIVALKRNNKLYVANAGT